MANDSQTRAPAQPQRAAPEEAYTGVLEKVFREVAAEIAEIEDQRGAAAALFAELSGFSPSQQKLRVRNSARYQNWAFAEELLARARQRWTEDPSHSQNLAELALEIAGLVKATGFRAQLLNDLKAEGWSYIANCLRIRSDYLGAQEAFRKAESLIAKGSGDRLERARLLDLKASLLLDRRAYQRADLVLAEVIQAYRSAEERQLEGRALMKRAKLLRESGQVESAIPVLERAASLISVHQEPWLALALKNNLINHLITAGRAEEAQKLLPDARELARAHGTRLDRLRLRWTEGLLCKALGQAELAEQLLMNVRDAFISAEIGIDVALVSLDLAVLCLEEGRTEEVRRLATESLPLFASRGVHREVSMAWSLFREAAEQDAVTLGLVQEVASRIRRGQGRTGGPTDVF